MNKRALPFFLLAAIAVGLSFCGARAKTAKELLDFAGRVRQDVLPTMAKTLQETVTKDGSAAAVPFCRDFAPKYGAELTAKWAATARKELGAKSFRFRRVSEKARNPKNAAGGEEARILQQWAQGKAEPAHFTSGDKIYTMHPIMISQPLCLQCHGEKLDAKTAAEIAKLYPQDKATGYKLGDLRGAFVTEMGF